MSPSSWHWVLGEESMTSLGWWCRLSALWAFCVISFHFHHSANHHRHHSLRQRDMQGKELKSQLMDFANHLAVFVYWGACLRDTWLVPDSEPSAFSWVSAICINKNSSCWWIRHRKQICRNMFSGWSVPNTNDKKCGFRDQAHLGPESAFPLSLAILYL